MTPWIRTLLVMALAAALGAQPAAFSLRLDRLAEPLKLLTSQERAVVDETVNLIRERQHAAALSKLLTLRQAHPDNSSLRILIAYAMLEAGNLAGAYEEARLAHEAPNGNSYKCWFLAKLAFLRGDTDACNREMDHLHKAGDLNKDLKSLRKEVADAKKRAPTH